MRRPATLLAVLAVALPACGEDEPPERPAPAATSPATGVETAPPTDDPGAAAALSAEDQEAIREVVVAAATNREPCEHLTARYLEEFVLDGVTSDDPAAACREAEEGQPQLEDSDVHVTEVRGAGDEAEVEFTLAGIDQRASVVRSGGRWLIDRFDA